MRQNSLAQKVDTIRNVIDGLNSVLCLKPFQVSGGGLVHTNCRGAFCLQGPGLRQPISSQVLLPECLVVTTSMGLGKTSGLKVEIVLSELSIACRYEQTGSKSASGMLEKIHNTSSLARVAVGSVLLTEAHPLAAWCQQLGRAAGLLWHPVSPGPAGISMQLLKCFQLEQKK